MEKLEIIELLEAYKKHVERVQNHYIGKDSKEMAISYGGELDALAIVLRVMKDDAYAMQLKRELGV